MERIRGGKEHIQTEHTLKWDQGPRIGYREIRDIYLIDTKGSRKHVARYFGDWSWYDMSLRKIGDLAGFKPCEPVHLETEFILEEGRTTVEARAVVYDQEKEEMEMVSEGVHKNPLHKRLPRFLTKITNPFLRN